MTDIVKRLRGDIPHRLIEDHGTVDIEALDAEREEAATEIERLREAIKKMIVSMDRPIPDWVEGYGWEYKWIAREALEGK